MEAAEFVHEFLKLCQEANQGNIHRIVQDMTDLVGDMSRRPFGEKALMEQILIQSEQNGVTLKQFLDKTVRYERALSIQSRNIIFTLVAVINDNNKITHDGLAHFLIKSGITEEAAKHLMEYHHCYREDKLAGQLVLDAVLLLSICTSGSEEFAQACGPSIQNAAYLYLDPDVNDSLIVLFATRILDAAEPTNNIHDMIFYPEFLEAAVARIQGSSFMATKRCHTVRQESNLFYDGGFINFSLRPSLHIINILLRSEDYQCILHDRLLEEASVSVYESVFKQGTDREQKEAVELFRQMSRHTCKKHENKEYLKLLLTLFVGIDTSELFLSRRHAAGSLGLPPTITTRLHEPPAASCTLGKRSINFVHDVLKIPEVFFHHTHNRCFCDHCMAERGDRDLYSRGEPPQAYVLPRGWFRFALKLPPRATSLDIFQKWHIAYHGTRDACILPILNVGDLLMPGDKSAESSIKPPTGHFDEGRKPEGFNIRQVFMSPSMNYAGLDAYAPTKMYKNPQKVTETLSARVGFQVRIQPGKYAVGPETVGATAKKIVIDKHFRNQELEWSTDLRGVVILTGILVKIE
jgi:hypothetical protein